MIARSSLGLYVVGDEPKQKSLNVIQMRRNDKKEKRHILEKESF